MGKGYITRVSSFSRRLCSLSCKLTSMGHDYCALVAFITQLFDLIHSRSTGHNLFEFLFLQFVSFSLRFLFSSWWLLYNVYNTRYVQSCSLSFRISMYIYFISLFRVANCCIYTRVKFNYNEIYVQTLKTSCKGILLSNFYFCNSFFSFFSIRFLFFELLHVY